MLRKDGLAWRCDVNLDGVDSVGKLRETPGISGAPRATHHLVCVAGIRTRIMGFVVSGPWEWPASLKGESRLRAVLYGRRSKARRCNSTSCGPETLTGVA